MEGPPPLYIPYVSPEQTKLDQHQETLETIGDKVILVSEKLKSAGLTIFRCGTILA